MSSESTSILLCITYSCTISHFRNKLSPRFLLPAASGVPLQCNNLFQSWTMTPYKQLFIPLKFNSFFGIETSHHTEPDG